MKFAAAKVALERALARFNELFGRGLVLSVALISGLGLAVGALVFVFFNSAPPNTLTLAAGPDGSAFRAVAEQYRKILARDGVRLRILATQGSRDNLARLADPHGGADVGFVLGGEAGAGAAGNLVSLGSIAYQPLMIFYRGPETGLLAGFKGRRLAIGAEGSGARELAVTLLKANGIQPGDGTQIVAGPAESAVAELLAGRVDAFFAMSDSTPGEVMRRLLRDPQIHLFSFAQADGYAHRIPYLNRLELPRGAIDFGEDIPPADVHLVAPSVELVARPSLHPALSDLLLGAAREVHGRAGLYKKAGEFPSPLEHEFPISPDAARYYASGKSFLYRTFPFWIASLIARLAAVIVPAAIVLVPGFRYAPAVYRWRMQSRIYRWYAALQRLEHEAGRAPIDPRRCDDLLHHLDRIEANVMKITVPPAFADLLYDLRGHLVAVRERLLAQRAASETAAAK